MGNFELVLKWVFFKKWIAKPIKYDEPLVSVGNIESPIKIH